MKQKPFFFFFWQPVMCRVKRLICHHKRLLSSLSLESFPLTIVHLRFPGTDANKEKSRNRSLIFPAGRRHISHVLGVFILLLCPVPEALIVPELQHRYICSPTNRACNVCTLLHKVGNKYTLSYSYFCLQPEFLKCVWSYMRLVINRLWR